MMYQRDMFVSCRLAIEAQQVLDDRREEGVDAKKNVESKSVMISTMIAVATFVARPDDLGGLGADLTDKFAGETVPTCCLLLELRIEKCPADLKAGGAAGTSEPRPTSQARASWGTPLSDDFRWRVELETASVSETDGLRSTP